MRKKLPWLKYDMKKAEYMEAKEVEKDAKIKLDEAVKTLKDLKEPIEYGFSTPFCKLRYQRGITYCYLLTIICHISSTLISCVVLLVDELASNLHFFF